ncbi:hypothetical protein [Methylophilus sp. OH31]|uniref:hypothetical protein n=1 Tax=Methylophilus sp. OH31 TaxID=1387312 RepID=UPI000464240E|nr:hypothetical protein [Methylophilus sp. OH31]
MSEYTVIRDAIQELGASVTEEQMQPEIFGSAYCVFEGTNHTSFRLVWDGKEGYGFLQSAKSAGLWQDVGPHVSGTSRSNSKFSELLSIAKGLLHSNA